MARLDASETRAGASQSIHGFCSVHRRCCHGSQTIWFCRKISQSDTAFNLCHFPNDNLSLLRLLSLVLLIIFCTKMKQFPHPYLDFTAHSENPACQSSWLSCILPLGGKQSQVLRRHGTSQQQRRVSSSRLSRVPTGRKIHDPVSHFRYHHVCMAYALAFCSSRRFRATDF